MPARIEIAPERLAEGKDLYENKHSAAREIALAFRVPPMLLAIADEAAPINAWRSPREPLDAFATFEGLEN